MKILIIAPRFHTNLYYRLQALSKIGRHKIKLLTLYQGKSENHDLIKPIIIGYSPIYLFLEKIIRLFKRRYIRSFWELKLAIPNISKLKFHIKCFNPDIIILKDYQSINELINLLLAKINNKKVILLIQTKKNNIAGSKFLLKLYLILHKILNVVYYISPIENSIKALKEARPANILYLPFPVKTKNIDKEYFQNGYINIISVGKFIIRKDQLTLLKSINYLKNTYNFKVLLVGEKVNLEYISKINKYIQDNKLQDTVNIEFDLSHNDISKKYSKFDLFILPSYDEPAPYSPVEAMANKLPIIVSDDCGSSCYIKSGVNGFIFSNKNYLDLAQKVKKVVYSKKNLINMGLASYKIASNNHSLEYFNSQFNKIINSYV